MEVGQIWRQETDGILDPLGWTDAGLCRSDVLVPKDNGSSILEIGWMQDEREQMMEFEIMVEAKTYRHGCSVSRVHRPLSVSSALISSTREISLLNNIS